MVFESPGNPLRAPAGSELPFHPVVEPPVSSKFPHIGLLCSEIRFFLGADWIVCAVGVSVPPELPADDTGIPLEEPGNSPNTPFELERIRDLFTFVLGEKLHRWSGLCC